MRVKLLVQLKGACAEFVRRIAELPIEHEQELILDQSVILQILGHIIQRIILGYGNGDHVIGLRQRQDVICRKPHDHCQQE